MSRRSRLEFQATQVAIRKPKKTFEDALEMLKRFFKRKGVELGHIEESEPPNFWWEYFIPTPTEQGTLMRVGFISAPTKSEARAALKREFRMKLPPGTKLVKGNECKSHPKL